MMPTSATFSEIRLKICRQKIVEAQRIVAWIALRKLGYCEADMACYRGVTPSCIYRSVLPGKKNRVIGDTRGKLTFEIILFSS